MTPTGRTVHIHYHRPPDRTDVYVQDLIHEDASVKVTLARDLQLAHPLVIGDRLSLERGSDAVWFTFPGAWHDIGRFHSADGDLTGIYANVLVPCVFEPGGTWQTTDLFLDLWIPVDRWDDGGRGARPDLLDEEELERARARGWVSNRAAERALEEAGRLIASAQSGSWPPQVVRAWTLDRARTAVESEAGTL